MKKVIFSYTDTEKDKKKHPPNCAFLALRKRDSSNPSMREKTFQNWREKKRKKVPLFEQLIQTDILYKHTHTHNTRTESQLKYQKKKQKYHNLFYFVNYSSEGRIKKNSNKQYYQASEKESESVREKIRETWVIS